MNNPGARLGSCPLSNLVRGQTAEAKAQNRRGPTVTFFGRVARGKGEPQPTAINAIGSRLPKTPTCAGSGRANRQEQFTSLAHHLTEKVLMRSYRSCIDLLRHLKELQNPLQRED